MFRSKDYVREEYWFVASDIAKNIGLDYTTQKELEKYLQFSRYTVFSYKKKTTTTILWRLTFFPLFLIYLILFCIDPLKWIFTGKSYYYSDGKLVKFLNSWIDKIYLDKTRVF